ncbi:MAG TPA: DUF3088 family protein [Kofleriaceae bacterium]|nr:DUF3088 family protein [Kofleriaceae bacterium]
MKDTVYVLRPGFTDKGTVFFCPYSAQVVGFLAYYPQVRDTIDVIELDFAKPREPLATVLGPDHQSAPMLVLGGAPVDVPDVKIKQAGGHSYVEKTLEILRYLAATRSLPAPH